MADKIAEYIQALKASDRLGHLVAYHRLEPGRAPVFAQPARPWPRAVEALLAAAGLERLYSHQAQACDLVRSGRHAAMATPTASGKSLVYNLPVIERYLSDPDSRALYLFPLKALAQDQRAAFEAFTAPWPRDARPRAAIYDGDTTPWFRKKIRADPPQVLMTNPEMLHLSLLPHHESWSTFLAGLSLVVVDEAHVYRGVLGSHMAQVFRRLWRVCRRFGQDPRFVFCSATIGNPGELAAQLTGVETAVVTESGAPQGKRHYLFINPVEGAAQTAILLLQAALHRGLRTIVYTQSRKLTELISLWASQRSGQFASRISAYRAGFLPEERREIEARMHSGELLAVISTSALELGIDIGALDLCILVGYPGTVMATLQRGGRVGRLQQESAVALVAGEDALDQYFMRHPEDFFERPPESAVVNPANPVILARHLECAAAELPLRMGEPWLSEPGVAEAQAELESQGRLLRSADGMAAYSRRKAPHREVDLRGAGATLHIERTDDGAWVGSVDEMRACKETHPGAVYLHQGKTYVVQDLDLGGRTVTVAPAKVDYYTRVRGNKETEILERKAVRRAFGTNVTLGRVRVTERITGYEKRRVRGGTLMNITPLDLPPLVFETEGLWFEVPPDIYDACYDAYMDSRGAIHALEHAAIGILPLLVMTDRNDLGGMSMPMHPDTGTPTVFIYDAAPGGVGLARQAFGRMEEVFEATLRTIRDCPCEMGCPSCVHSPKCGSGNRPIDKGGALYLLERMAGGRDKESHTGSEIIIIQNELQNVEIPRSTGSREAGMRYGVFDLETRRSAQEVGGWNRADRMGISVAVLYDSATDGFETFTEDQAGKLVARLKELDLVVGFNLKRFDYKVLGAHTSENLQALPTLDMLEKVRERLGFRLSLDSLARTTLGAAKSADGLQALEWWKQGRVQEITDYCTQDVAVTRDLYLHGRDKGFLLYTTGAGKAVRVPVDW